MTINGKNIQAGSVASIIIQGSNIQSGDGLTLLNDVRCIVDNIFATQVYSGETWNKLNNNGNTFTPLVNIQGVTVFGWSITPTVYDQNGNNLQTLPFYPSGVYLENRMTIDTGAFETFTLAGLNDNNLYSFIFSGATSSTSGAGSKEITFTSDVSAATAVILTDSADTDNDHIDTLALQSPSSGQIVITATSSSTNRAQLSTFVIEEYQQSGTS